MFLPRAPHLSARRAAFAVTVVLGTTFAGHANAAAWSSHTVIVGYRARPTRTAPATPGRLRRHTLARRGAHARRPSLAHGHTRNRVVHLPRDESVPAALRRLRRRPGVAYAEPDYVAHAAGSFYPDDRGRSGHRRGWQALQWNLLPGTGVDAPLAWSNLLADHRPGGRGVTIAVLDTGVAYRNWQQYRRSPDLGNTRIVDPYDFIAHNHFPLDRNGHGTFVASLLAESTNNGIGLTGLAYGASIMPLRVLNSQGLGDESTIAQGIRYAVNHHASIINLSLEFVPAQVHSGSAIPQMVSAIAYARHHGVMVVGAAGNDEMRKIAYPAAVQGVVSVGATTKDGCLANYSNLGRGLDLVAPGGGSDAIRLDDPACHPGRILPPIFQMTLTDPPHWSEFGYPNSYIGTSMASPEVAAAAALVISSGVIGRHPTPGQILNRLERTAAPLPAGGRQPNPTYGYGLLDVGAATSPMAIVAPARAGALSTGG